MINLKLKRREFLQLMGWGTAGATLAGCDLLTISPELMAQLAASQDPVSRALDPAQAKAMQIERVSYDEPSFRHALNEDAMASEKLGEGIRAFAADAIKLEALMKA